MTDKLIETARAVFAARIGTVTHLKLTDETVKMAAVQSFQIAKTFEAVADTHRPQVIAQRAEREPQTYAAATAEPEKPPVVNVVDGAELVFRQGAFDAVDAMEGHSKMPEQRHRDTIFLTPCFNLDLSFGGQPKGPEFTGWMVQIPIHDCGPFQSAAVILLYGHGWHSTKRFKGDGAYTHWTNAGQDEIAQYIKALPTQVRHGLEMVLTQVMPPEQTPLIGGSVLALWPHRHHGRWCFSILNDKPLK